MNTFRTFAVMTAILSLMAFQCSDEPIIDDNEKTSQTPSISMSSTNIYIYPAEHEGTATFQLEATNATEIAIRADFDIQAELEQTGEYEWEVTLSQAKNMEDGKKYLVYVTAKNEHGTFEKAKAVYKSYLTSPFSSQDYDVEAVGQSFTLPIKGNVKWNATVTEGDASWYKLSKTSSSITFTVNANTATEARSLTLKVADEAANYVYTATFNQPRGPETQDEILVKERAALLALNEALNIGCDTSKPHTEWGIATFNSKGYVTNIRLSRFTGYIPEEIGDLKYCWELTLTNCNLSGQLPVRIGEMERLKIFDIQGCGLEGNLSESTLSKIAHQLIDLGVGLNNFTGPVPEWIGDMPDHACFSISMNRLSGKIPEKVLKHKWWTSPNLTGSEEKTYGEFQLKQQEGYVLYE